VPTSTAPTRTLVHVRIEAHRVLPHTLAIRGWAKRASTVEALPSSGTRVTTIGQTHSSREVWGSKAQTREGHPSPILTASRRLFLESVACPVGTYVGAAGTSLAYWQCCALHRVHHLRLNC
jgi:hypothetical protein